MDSYRYLNFLTRKVVKAWIEREPKREIPWTPVRKPLAESTVALISSAGVAPRSEPFDESIERNDPWNVDQSHRVIARDATERDVVLQHLHIDTRYGAQDLNCVMPLTRLAELEASGRIGRSAPSHYSFHGYVLQPRELLEKSAPAMIRQMKADHVDLALLVPA